MKTCGQPPWLAPNKTDDDKRMGHKICGVSGTKNWQVFIGTNLKISSSVIGVNTRSTRIIDQKAIPELSLRISKVGFVINTAALFVMPLPETLAIPLMLTA